MKWDVNTLLQMHSIDKCGHGEGNDWINKIHREIPWPSFIHCSELWFHRWIWKFIEKVAKSNIFEHFRFNWILHQYKHFSFSFFLSIVWFLCFNWAILLWVHNSWNVWNGIGTSQRRSKVSNVGVNKIFSILSTWIESSQPFWQNYRISICAIWIWDIFGQTNWNSNWTVAISGSKFAILSFVLYNMVECNAIQFQCNIFGQVNNTIDWTCACAGASVCAEKPKRWLRFIFGVFFWRCLRFHLHWVVAFQVASGRAHLCNPSGIIHLDLWKGS